MTDSYTQQAAQGTASATETTTTWGDPGRRPQARDKMFARIPTRPRYLGVSTVDQPRRLGVLA